MKPEYEKNKTSYQDDEWFENERRNMFDVNRVNRELTNQTFYSICHDNENYYREIQFKHNPFARKLVRAVGNPIKGKPPEGMKPVPTGIGQLDMWYELKYWR